MRTEESMIISTTCIVIAIVVTIIAYKTNEPDFILVAVGVAFVAGFAVAMTLARMQ